MNRSTFALTCIFTLAGCIRCIAGTTGVMHGYVRDINGRPVEDVLVTVKSRSQTAETHTNKRGFFVFLILPPDVYTVMAQKVGTSGAYAIGARIDRDQTTFLNLRVNRWRRCGPLLTRVSSAAYQGSADVWSLDVRKMSEYPPNLAPFILQPAAPVPQTLMCL